MLKTKLVAVSAAALAAVAGVGAVTPASAQTLRCGDLPISAPSIDPYVSYLCETADDALTFALQETNDAVTFVQAVRDDAGALVFRVYCMVFPNQPQCL